jgi:hypothetical protein
MDSVLPLALTECGGHKKQLRKMRVFRPWPPRGSFRATVYAMFTVSEHAMLLFDTFDNDHGGLDCCVSWASPRQA